MPTRPRTASITRMISLTGRRGKTIVATHTLGEKGGLEGGSHSEDRCLKRDVLSESSEEGAVSRQTCDENGSMVALLLAGKDS